MSVGGVGRGGRADLSDDEPVEGARGRGRGPEASAEAEAIAPARRSRRAPREARLPFHRGSTIRELGPKSGKLPEPSGIAFHRERGTLFVCGDRGDLAEVDREGKVLQRAKVDGLDLEGITVGPKGRIYAVAEDPPRLVELDADTLEVRRELKVKAKLDGERVIARQPNEGLEGLCYVPEEGAFFAVNQAHPAAIVRIEVPRDGDKAEITELIPLKGIVEEGASDVAWDPETKHFLVTEAGGRKRGQLHEVSRDGEHVRSVWLPGHNAEGFALDDRGSAFVAQDAGRLMRIDP